MQSQITVIKPNRATAKTTDEYDQVMPKPVVTPKQTRITTFRGEELKSISEEPKLLTKNTFGFKVTSYPVVG